MVATAQLVAGPVSQNTGSAKPHDLLLRLAFILPPWPWNRNRNRKTDQVLTNANMLDICGSNFTDDWRDCPNCCQPYHKNICTLMGQALVQFTEDRNLPKTHYVLFEARVFFANTLIYSSQSKEEFKGARNMIEFLLNFVEEECSTLAAEWWGEEAKGQLLKECQTGRLLLMLGRAHQRVGTMLKSQNMDQPANEVTGDRWSSLKVL